MKWLLWREYRLNRLIVITGAILLLLPYVFVFIGIWWTQITMSSSHQEFTAAANYSIVLSLLTLALIGGNAIAGERADRSAEFMAYLPVSRTRRLVSKLILAMAAIAIIWGINLLVFWILTHFSPKWIVEDELLLSYLAISGWMIYGVAWFISSMGSSPTFAVAGGLVMPLIVVMSLQFVAWAFDVGALIEHLGPNYTIISSTLGTLGFTAGTWYYLTRVEP